MASLAVWPAMDDDGLADLADSLLRYDREQEDARLGIDELAHDLLRDVGVHAPVPVPGCSDAPDPGPSPHELVLQRDTGLLYGPPAVRNLGNQMQRALMNRVYAELSRQSRQTRGQQNSNEKPKQLQDKTNKAVLDLFVLSTKTLTVAAAALFAGIGEKNLKRGIEATAAFTLYGGTWLIGAMLSCWRQLGTFADSGEPQQKIFCLTRMKYDETPLRLKVAEFNALFGLRDGDGGVSSLHKTSKQEEYRFAKIFRILFKLGFLDSLVRLDNQIGLGHQ